MMGGTETTLVMETVPPANVGQEDFDLVLAAKQDIAEFDPLYRRYVDPIYRYCYRRLESPDLAADATSQVFIKAMSSIGSCREATFRSWLFSIAHNVMIDQFRSKRFESSIDEAEALYDRSPSPEESAIANEDRSEVIELLNYLTPDQRQIVELRLAGLNGNDIAQVLGRSRASVDTAQSRAISRLRAVLVQNRQEPLSSGGLS